MPTRDANSSTTDFAPPFLDGISASKGRWRDAGEGADKLIPRYFWTGQGRDALEVAYSTAPQALSATEARDVWRARQGRSAAPLLLVVAYPGRNGARATVCGPSGDAPAVVDLDLSQAERLATAGLTESNRHLAIRTLAFALEQARDEVPGLRNRGLLATHELTSGVPRRKDWTAATTKSGAAL